MTEQEMAAAAETERKRREQWDKDHPDIHVGHLTQSEQSARDIERQEETRKEKKAQADKNIADQAWRQAKVDAAEVAEQAKSVQELEAEDVAAPYGRDSKGKPLPKPLGS